jgi:acyl-CoA thioester hydrolase
MNYAAVQPISTRFADNDVFGHVNNAVYYSYFDTAINGWIQELTGVATWELPALGVVATSQCEFRAEVHFPQQLRVGLRVARLGVKSVTYELGLWADGDAEGALRASGRWVHVYVDPVTRASVPVPAVLRAALERLSTPEPASRCVSPT